MAEPTQWRETEQLAWTENDGPGRPPAGSNALLSIGLAGVLAAVFTGMLLTDTLCPEHRAWVQTLGSIALVGCVASIVALARGMAIGPVITLGTTAIGVVIGYIDAIHSGTRGLVIMAAFAAVLVGAGWLYHQQRMVQRWDHSENGTAPLPRESLAPLVEAPMPAERSAEPAADRSVDAEVR